SYRVLSVQAEDGIRHRNVTGVQTCALPILPAFVISAILYWVVGATLQSGSGDLTIAQETMTSLEETFNISWVMLIPAAIVIVLLALRMPSVPVIVFGALLGSLWATIFQGYGFIEAIQTM